MMTPMAGSAMGVVVVLAVSGAGVVAAQGEKPPEVFKMKTANMTPAGLGLKVDILRWCSEDQRGDAIAALGADGGLEDLPTVGYVWPDDSGLGYAVKYAHRVETADGGEHITLVTGRPLGTFSREPWAARGVSAKASEDYTVIELRLDKGGRGAGTMSLATGITVDPAAHIVSLENYDAAPVLLEAVSRQPEPYWARQ